VPNDSSKQKRSRANKAQRAALEARRTAASTPRPSRQAPVATSRSSKVSKAPSAGNGDEGATGKAGRSARAGRERPVRPGDVPVDVDELEGSHYAKVMQVPGGRQVITALFASVVASIAIIVLGFTLHSEPLESLSEKAKKTAPGIDTFVERHGVLPAVLPPVLVVAFVLLAYVYALHRQRRRIWLAVTLVTAFIGLRGIYYLPSLGMMAYALFRAAKVEGPNEPLFGRRRRAGTTDEDDVTDDADVVDTSGKETAES
jgi:hypothetical protein